jgi:hypothetical protein
MSIFAEKPFLRELIDALWEPVEVLKRTSKLLETQRRGEALQKVDAPWNPPGGWRSAAAEYNTTAIEEARVDQAFDEIRDDAGFEALIKETKKPAGAEQPLRYAITLDPGPELLALAREPPSS